jgi:hypothetical protein
MIPFPEGSSLNPFSVSIPRLDTAAKVVPEAPGFAPWGFSMCPLVLLTIHLNFSGHDQ